MNAAFASIQGEGERHLGKVKIPNGTPVEITSMDGFKPVRRSLFA
jgi:hypothetical protein